MSVLSSSPSSGTPVKRALPLEVFVLGLVSFLTDVSSEMIFAVLPIYFVSVIGGSAIALGVMEGIADFAGSSLDLASGYASDRSGKRKWIAFSGYGLSTTAKSLLLIVSSVAGVMAFRIIERLGKSIRGAPRDAMLSSIAPTKMRGFAFGVHKALDKTGAVIGPLVAYFVLTRFGSAGATFYGLFFAALIPAVIALFLLGVCIRERPTVPRPRMDVRKTLSELGPRYWWYLAATAVFSLGYFSFAFLLLAAKEVGFGFQEQALIYAFFNLVFTVVSVPAGWIGDRVGRRAIVISSYVLYACMCAGFLFATSQLLVIAMFTAYGVFFALDEGQSKAYLADLSKDEYRATAIGIYGFVTGLAYLPASMIAGVLWDYDPFWMFAFAIATSLSALVLFAVTSQRHRG